ncbi:MAG: PD-(D/E)XK nuclease family protein [Candidatus Methylomirabilia bacterium]
MNTFIAALAGLCASRPLDEKRLVAPSRRVGNQWLDDAARAGQPVLNVRVETLRSLAVDLAAPALASLGLAVAPRRAEQLLIDRVLRTLLREGRLPWLSRARPGAGLAATVLATLLELRREDVPEERLRKGVLEDARKSADLKLLVGEYGRLLAEEGLADYARVLRLAAERLAAEPDALGPDALVLIPEDHTPNGLERRLLEALPAGRLRRLAVDPPGIPAHVAFSCAVGESNEVRCVLRGCLESGTPLDEVEVLYTDTAYAQALEETFAAVDRPGVEPTDEAPVTFAEGLPCTLSRPGRGLAGWLRWMSEGYPQSALVTMVREGLLETGETDGGRVGFSRLAALVRSIPIGQERERYLPKIDESIAAVVSRLENVDTLDAEGDPGGEPEARREQLARKIDELRVVRGLVDQLVRLSPPPGADGAALVGSAVKFLATCARSVGRFDGFAAEKLREELDEMAHWLGRAGGMPAADVRDWLAALPAAARVGGSGPRPGCLHADHVRSGGHSGRPQTFIVGLDEGRFPGAGLQDPLLLDSERARLDPALPTAGRRLEETVQGFKSLLGRLRGRATLCWPCRDVVEDSERFPSQVVLDAFRLARAAPSAAQDELTRAAGTPASFAPENPARALDAGEWWLWRFTGEETVANPGEILARRAPHLVRGSEAAARRNSAAFTPWDGRVPRAGAALDPTSPTGKVLSSNGLETAGACPRKFFYRYALEIAPPEELVVDPERWLDPLLTGSLLHELFEEYVRTIAGTGWPADFARGRALILGLLEKKLAASLAAYPSPSPAAFASERELLVLAAETLVREEERHALETDSEPVYVEASLGMPPGEHGTALDHPDPIPVVLPGGSAIRVRGRVDRIDSTGGGAGGWAIWDYKTGSTWGYDRADPFPEGRKIQPYLYLRMVERRLRDTVGPQAAVRSFGYFFPGARGRGERIGWDAGRLAAGGEVLAGLCRIIATGAFAATTDADRDCRLCDYRGACGDVAEQAAASVRKVRAGEPLLEPLRELRAKSLAKAAASREEEE